MKRDWTHGLKEEEKEGFRKKLLMNRDVFDQEKAILVRWLEKEFNASIGLEEFDNPNWPYLQAYHKGKMKAFKEVISLLEGLTSE